MLEKPKIPEALIARAVRADYGLDVARVTFLPLGYDVNTAVYHVQAQAGAEYFLKLRLGEFNPITVAVPHLLNSQGIHAVMAPIQTRFGQLVSTLENFTIILYPYIPGKDGYQVSLVDLDWVELGWTLKSVHHAPLPPSIALSIPREVFDPQWRKM